jgi:hypothetical protein
MNSGASDFVRHMMAVDVVSLSVLKEGSFDSHHKKGNDQGSPRTE